VKIGAIVALLAAATSDWAGETGQTAERALTVCVETSGENLAYAAEALASKVFEAIGVSVTWRQGLKHCPPGSGTILVTLALKTQERKRPGALAYALPYEGTHIVVYFDRVQKVGRERTMLLLAYVLAHEIAHILEGVVRHSRSGIMKARWDNGDYFEMGNRRKPLEFAREDVLLIYEGLDQRRFGLSASAGAQ